MGAEVIPEGLVMLRIRDHCAVYHNELSLFSQLRVVLLEATQESSARVSVIVQVARCQKSWHDSAWFYLVVVRMVINPILAHSATER